MNNQKDRRIFCDMDNQEDKRVFCDMDGVSAMLYARAQFEEEMYEKGFFRTLNPYTEVVEALKIFREKHPEVEFFVLSACITEWAKEDKFAWLQEFLPVPASNCIFMGVGENKAKFVPGGIGANDFLLDDYTKNLQEWTAAGGTAIKMKNEINCRKGTWTGNMVSSFDTPDKIVKDLENYLGL